MRPTKYHTDEERAAARVLYNHRHYTKRQRAAALQVPCVQIGDLVTLYCGDARVIAPLLHHIHAVIADPPYGTGFQYTKRRRSRTPLQGVQGGARWATNIPGDDQPFDPAPWLHYPQIILWGAQHYASRLPDSRAWLTWDKRVQSTPDHHADCEYAWTNLGGVARIFYHKSRGIIREGEENVVHGGKLHQAQKPVALMRWCVEKTTGTVLDPFMGSGSTLVACVRLGRPCIGIEIHEESFQVACDRLQEAVAQG